MADPTQAARDKVGGFLKSLLPANSPLNKSLDAGNPSVLTEEAQKKRAEADALEAQAVNTQQAAIEGVTNIPKQTEFVDQSLPQLQTAPIAPQSNIAEIYDQSASKLGASQVAAGNAEAAVLNKQGQIAAQQAADLEAKQLKADADLKMISDDTAKAQEDLDSFKIEPVNFFSNKSTWQKVVGGIGLFLGSLSAEGARNVASIIDKQIERDTDMQKQEYALRKGKVDAGNNRYKMYLDKYKDSQIATMALNREKLAAIDFQLKATQAKSKGQLARDKLEMGRVEIAYKDQELAVRMQQAMQKQSSSTIQGYKGSNANPSIVKDIYDRTAAARAANDTISELEKLGEAGAVTPLTKNNKLATQMREKLSADLAKAMFGRSSDSELEIARELIPDITSMTQLKSTDKALLKNLKQRLQKDVDAYARQAGYTRDIPQGAKRID
jgi:hypothetical protein